MLFICKLKRVHKKKCVPFLNFLIFELYYKCENHF